MTIAITRVIFGDLMSSPIMLYSGGMPSLQAENSFPGGWESRVVLWGEAMRYWVWVLVRLLVGVGIVAWAMSYIGPGSGEKEFQRTIDALKKVDGVEYTMVANSSPTTHMEESGEMVCSQHAIHIDNHITSRNSGSTSDLNQETTRIGADGYGRWQGGPWQKDFGPRTSESVCGRLAMGVDSWLFPGMNEMLKRGIIQKGDKKTVNGVQCREWNVAIRYAADLEHRTVCLGVDDHLPREMTVPRRGVRWAYTSFNQVFEIRPPDGPIVEPKAQRAPAYNEPIRNVPDTPNTED